tara:strand:- start:486 stop:1055 length:570 start_codon:yes stop_codon:yes gene_type:complete
MSRIADTLVTYRLLKLMSTPIKNSQAFKMGIIDGDGKQLRKANTAQEKEAYTFLNRFVFKIQNALMRSSDRNARRLLTFAAALALLKEYKEEDDEVTVGALMENYMDDSNVQRHARLLERYEILSFAEFVMDEEVAANAVGGGGVDGIGIGTKGEPGVPLNRWPFPGIGMPSMFRRKPVIKKRKKKNAR